MTRQDWAAMSLFLDGPKAPRIECSVFEDQPPHLRIWAHPITVGISPAARPVTERDVTTAHILLSAVTAYAAAMERAWLRQHTSHDTQGRQQAGRGAAA